MNGRNNAFR